MSRGELIHAEPGTSRLSVGKLASVIFLTPLYALSYFFNIIGLRAFSALGAALGDLLRIVHFRRCVVRENIRLALGKELSPEAQAKLLRDFYREMGTIFLSIVRNFTLTREQAAAELSYSEESRQIVDRALANGRGALFISAHIANWELVAMGIAARGYPVTIIVKKMSNPIAQHLIESLRLRTGLEVIYAGGTIEKMKQALRNGRAIGFMVDQNTTGPKGIRANFFGVPASSIRGLAGLVRDTGTAVMPICAHRNPDGTHQFVIGEPLPYLEAPELPENSPERRAREEWLNTQQYQTAVEQLVRARPAQWLWLHRRWKAKREPLPPGFEHIENIATLR